MIGLCDVFMKVLEIFRISSCATQSTIRSVEESLRLCYVIVNSREVFSTCVGLPYECLSMHTISWGMRSWASRDHAADWAASVYKLVCGCAL